MFKVGDRVRAINSTALLPLNYETIVLATDREGQIAYINVPVGNDGNYDKLSYYADYLEVVSSPNETTPTHICKSWPHFFKAIRAGEKLHDLRKMDRDFKVGDTILLKEYDPALGLYTGSQCMVTITYITSAVTPCALSSNALDKGHCILSLKLIPV